MKWMLLPSMLIMTAVQAEVPHKFSAGEPARASEVNENFQYLEDRINDSNCPSKTTWEDMGVPRPTYSYLASTPGDSLTVDGHTYYIVKLPFIHPLTGEIYAITLPVDSESYDGTDPREIQQSFTLTRTSQYIDNPCDAYSISGFTATVSASAYTSYTYYSSTGINQRITDTFGAPYIQIAVSGITIGFQLSGEWGWLSANTTTLSPSLPSDLDLSDLLTTENYSAPDPLPYVTSIDRLIDYIHVEKIAP